MPGSRLNTKNRVSLKIAVLTIVLHTAVSTVRSRQTWARRIGNVGSVRQAEAPARAVAQGLQQSVFRHIFATQVSI
jgi:hypothetical protein